MDRDVAVRLDGMLTGVRGNLDGIAHYMKNNLSKEEFKKFVGSIGGAMGETIDVSNELYKIFPDIVPKELKPPKKRKEI